MSTKQLKLKIITPERLILEELVSSVSIPTPQGEITILPNHVPLIGTVSSGDVVALETNQHVPIAVVGGFLEVKTEDGMTTVAILADFAEHVGDLTDEVIVAAKAKAEELKKLADNREIVDFEHFETELERSLTRVKIADKWKTRKYRQ